MRNTAVSLFSGCGGLDLGVAQAGFSVLAGVEIDANCVATLGNWTSRLSHPHRIYHRDIRALDPRVVMADLALAPGELNLLCGGPPCQAFSAIGFRRGLDDERGMLLFEMARFAEAFRPRVVLIEQVRGLLNFRMSDGRRVLHVLRESLESLGYDVRWSVLQAADYGVPQLRQRLFIVASQPDQKYVFPAPTHGATRGLFGKQASHATVGEALANLSAPVRKERMRPDADANHVDVTPAGDQRRIHSVPEGEYLSAQLHLPAELRGKLHPQKDSTKYRRLHRRKPSLTLRCGEIHYHPTEDRYLTPREYLCIHGYPDWFTLLGPIRSRSGRVRDLDQHRQVANSVPPPLAHAVAGSIRSMLEAPNDAERVGAIGLLDRRPIRSGNAEPVGVQVSLFGS